MRLRTCLKSPFILVQLFEVCCTLKTFIIYVFFESPNLTYQENVIFWRPHLLDMVTLHYGWISDLGVLLLEPWLVIHLVILQDFSVSSCLVTYWVFELMRIGLLLGPGGLGNQGFRDRAWQFLSDLIWSVHMIVKM